MKKILAISLALILALSLCACGGDNATSSGGKDDQVSTSLLTQVVITQRNPDDTRSTMKAVLEYDADYNIIAGKSYLDDKLYNEMTFDKDPSKPLFQQDYDENGEKDGHWIYTYDDNGNELSSCKYDADGKILWKYVQTYDANGNVLTEQDYQGDELQNEYRYVYNADGKLEIRYSRWSDDEEESWTKYIYDEYGNVAKELSGCGEEEYNTTIYRNVYENGKLVEIGILNAAGELYDLTRYDADGNVILSASYYDGEEYYRTEYIYENGKQMKQIGYNNGEESYRQENTYNADGLIMERTVVRENSTSRQVYTYNGKGLPTSYKAYDGDELVGEAAITYETVTVSKETAKKIEAIIDALELF